MIAAQTTTLGADEYLEEVEAAIRWRWCVPAPTTTSQLKALIAHRPDIARNFLPDKSELRRLV
jgi:hypothetical protein